MKEGTTYKRLGEVASYINGFAFKPETWTNHGLPIVRIQNLNNSNAEYNYYAGELPDKFVINDGDLLISWSASLGTYIWRGGKAYLNQHIFKVVFDKSDIAKSYLKYVVESKLMEMKKNVHGSTMQHIVKGDFNNTRIPVPSLEEQEGIVAELDCIGAIIADKKQQLRELDNLAQAIFYDVFGANAEDFKLVHLGDYALFLNGDRSKNYPSGKDFVQSGIPFINAGHLKNGKVDFTSMDYISKEKYDELRAGKVKEGDILFCLRGSLGKLAMVDFTSEGAIASSLVIIRPNNTIDNYYLKYYLGSEFVKVQIARDNNGSSQPNLSAKSVSQFTIPQIPLALQEQFAEKVKAIEEQKEMLRQSIAESESLLTQRMEFHFA